MAVDYMQRAEKYLERAAYLEGTGQPKVCGDYVRRSGELIEQARTRVAVFRGPEAVMELQASRWEDFIVALDVAASMRASISRVENVFAEADAAIAGLANEARRLAQ
ncbi:hypothetical protein [Arthrobacter sp. JSM 101049]|uniref:hypothetical protein n=1 Tax=Arthrobacter sp. JSM 101049 TaxID=929097 RepID=UPI00356535FA